jgi:hypothetical protein
MKQQKHCEMDGRDAGSTCTGTVKRNGWCWQSIDGHSWCCVAWKCDKCGKQWWSWRDEDNGDRSYDEEADEGEEE